MIKYLTIILTKLTLQIKIVYLNKIENIVGIIKFQKFNKCLI